MFDERTRKLTAAILFPVVYSLWAPCWAAGGVNLLEEIRQAKVLPPPAHCQLINLPDQLIVLTAIEGNYSETSLKSLALKIAAIIANEGISKRAVFVFSDSTGSGKATTLAIKSEQMKTLHDQANSLEASALEIGEGDIAVATADRPSDIFSANADMSNLQMERNKLTTEIAQLRASRVGVKPFLDEIARADEQLRHGDARAAKQILDHLSGAIDEYVRQRQARATSTGAAAVSLGSANQLRTGGAQPGQAMTGMGPGLSSMPQGISDEAANQILKQYLGDLAPVEGPMRFERVTIARRIQSLRQSGARVENYLAAYSRIEEIAGAKDAEKRMTLLRDEILYLNKQLGVN